MMLTDEQLDKRLEALSGLLSDSPAVAQHGSLQLEQMSQPTKTHMKHWVIRPALGVAAGLLLGVVLWFVAVAGNQSLYAKTLEALKQARSVHVLGYIKQDGQWQKETELWYERDRGVREWAQTGNRTRIRLDDGQHQWLYRSEEQWAIRSPSTDPVGVVTKTLNPERLLRRSQRDMSGDRLVDGVPCQMHVQMNPSKTARSAAWLDGDNRIRRFEEHHLRAGKWKADELIEASYDVPIDPIRFKPNFGPGVQIIESRPVEDNSFALEKAIYVKEVMGLVFAVHELKRVEGGLVYVLHSTRPSEQTTRELGPIPPPYKTHVSYGRVQLDSGGWPFGRRRSHQPVDLAEFNGNGMRVEWALMIPKGDWPEPMKTFELSVRVFTDDKLREKHLKTKSNTVQRIRPLVVLPLPKETTRLSDILTAVHQEVLRLETIKPAGYGGLLHIETLALTETEIQKYIQHGEDELVVSTMTRSIGAKASDVSAAEFVAIVRVRLARLRNLK